MIQILIFACLVFSFPAGATALDDRIHDLYQEISSRVDARGEADQQMPAEERFRMAVLSWCSFLEDRTALRMVSRPERLAFVDYTLPANEPRLFLFDFKSRVLLHQTYATHGYGSWGGLAFRLDPELGLGRKESLIFEVPGWNETRFFSARAGSSQSSLGFAVAAKTPYFSGEFQSHALRMTGLDGPLNESLLSRGVVFHEWDYRAGDVVRSRRIPPSEGCLMFPKADDFEGERKVRVTEKMNEDLKGVPVLLYEERLTDSGILEAQHQEERRQFQEWSEEVRGKLAALAESQGWSSERLQALEDEFLGRLKTEWLQKSEETYRYLNERSRWIGKRPRNDAACAQRFSGAVF